MNLARQNEWLWTSRWTHWWCKRVGPVEEIAECMDPFFRGGLDADEIARGVRALKEARINTVLTEGLRRLILFEQEGKTDAVIDAVRRVTEVCHQAGIRVVHHTTTVFAGHGLNDIPEDRRDWLNIDARTGGPAFIDWVGGWHLWCINNPAFRTEYFRLCRKTLRETGVDGFMVDEVYFRTGWHNCACPQCRKKFRVTTGFTLPIGAAPSFWGQFDNPAFRAWLRFRTASVGDFYQDLQTTLRKAHPHPVLLGCKNHEPSPSNTQEFGDSNEERMRGVNVLFAEIGGGVGFAPSWRRFAFELTSYGGLSNFYGTPTLSIIYCKGHADGFLWWALRMAHGVRVWATAGDGELAPQHQLLDSPRDLALYGPLFRWEEKHEGVLAGAIRPFAEIGVLLSAATRDLIDHARSWDRYVRELVGWCEVLTEEHLQYAVIMEQELTLPRLRQFALVILPNAVCLSDAACRALVEYVAGGGHVIVTHETGLRDESGSKRNTAHRLRELGVTRQGTTQGVPRSPQEGGAVCYGAHGKGRWVYFTHKPGLAVYTTANGVGDLDDPLAFTQEEQALQRSLMIQAVRWATGDRWSMTVEQAPRGILIKAFTRQEERRRSVLIHLLRTPEAEGENPARTRYIRLHLRLATIETAYLISPEWEGRKTAKVERVDDGFVLTIPLNTMKRYAVLYVECDAQGKTGCVAIRMCD